jgi:hypothetical protein
VIITHKRPASIWLGPMRAAARLGEVGADSREMKCLLYGVYDKPDRDVAPFRLPIIHLDAENSAAMEIMIKKHLDGRIWREMTPAKAKRCRFMSREFIARDSDGKSRSVADLSHLSEHYDPVITKSEGLECFAASLIPEDTMLSMNLKSGYHHLRLHPDMRQEFSVTVMMADGTMRFLQYIALPFGWCRSGYWFVHLISRVWTYVKSVLRYRVLSYIDDFLNCPSLGRRSTGEDCVKAARVLDSLLSRYGLTRHSTKGVWGRGSQCVIDLGFVVDTKRGIFGVPAHKLEGVSERARKLLVRARINRRRVPAKELEVFIGKSQSLSLAVPDTAYRL